VAYLIWSNEQGAWRGPADKRGYTLFIEEAGRYDLDEARAIVGDATPPPDAPPRQRASHFNPDDLVVTAHVVLVLAPEDLDDR
jgi:hypothetical protein